MADVAVEAQDTFWKDILGSTATFATICQFLSGMFTVHRIIVQQKRSVGDLSPVPFLAGAVGCTCWLIYGYLKDDAMIVRCNVVGCLLNSFYVAVFVKFSIIRTLMFRQVSAASIFVTSILLYVHSNLSDHIAQLAQPNHQDTPLVQNLGLICVVITILGCASPLVALKEVIRSKSTDTLPFPLIFSMFLVCSLWWGYGVLANDPYMQFTNFLGSCIALLQLSLFLCYSSNRHEYKKFHSSI